MKGNDQSRYLFCPERLAFIRFNSPLVVLAPRLISMTYLWFLKLTNAFKKGKVIYKTIPLIWQAHSVQPRSLKLGKNISPLRQGIHNINVAFKENKPEVQKCKEGRTPNPSILREKLVCAFYLGNVAIGLFSSLLETWGIVPNRQCEKYTHTYAKCNII